MFTHKPIIFTDYEGKIENGKRFYKTKTGKYPSVTTVLGQTADKSFLKAWRERIGEEAADWQTKFSSERGTEFHDIAERYLKNNPDYVKMAPRHQKFLFAEFKKKLDKHVNNIICQEEVLYSDRLKLAGRVDCIAYWDSIITIIDFKTSKKRKKEEWIEDYKLQVSAYALMFMEMTGVKCVNYVILIAVAEDKSTQIFKGTIHNHIQPLLGRIKQYEEGNK